MSSMDLVSDNLYWPTTCGRIKPSQALPRRVRCDALVIGSGITGAMAAYHLTEIGASIEVVDRRRLASGSTAASTALVQFELDVPLIDLVEMRGPRPAEEAYIAAYEGLLEMERLVRSLPAECGLHRRPSVFLAVSPDDALRLEREAAARRRIGLPAVQLDRRNLLDRFRIDRPGAIVTEPAYELNPLRVTQALLKEAMRRGACVAECAAVDLATIGEKSRPFRFAASDGSLIEADWVVIATGYETPEQFDGVANLCELRSTYAVASEPLPGEPWPERALLWEIGDPYFYARTTTDGRMLLGGEDDEIIDPAARDRRIESKARLLAGKARRLIPGPPVVESFRWAGTFARTRDGLPYIGAHPDWPNVLFTLGFGGNGILFSLIAARLIAEAINGRPEKQSRLFAFDR